MTSLIHQTRQYHYNDALQTVAMLPYCFKTYPDKSSSWPELMALFKMNLIEFTPGYGSEKYTEVNRILANRAADTGGCIVARSQMHNIIEERPTLDRTVEKRLLMPSFNHNDIIFPVDGPLGRCGPSLRSTLECPLSDPDWPRCSVQQMVLRDQRHWLTKLCALVPDQGTTFLMMHHHKLMVNFQLHGALARLSQSGGFCFSINSLNQSAFLGKYRRLFVVDPIHLLAQPHLQ
ncbi:unnamed protein product [Haemonchus placei]|uniref:RNase_Zc3h12a domain-containing protein n=1 Tax=Haemonchus placei TaxID=6290 RepID=A0A0N4WWM1_HAEPC|nr:unnamed protein product [Haemonchus placei]